MKTDNMVVVGGGSAGWMAAATLIRFYPNKNISVIESPDVPKIGVGESTLGQIRVWTNILGIDEKDFMKHTNASYKLSIGFTDFYEKDSGTFHYPFGAPLMNGDQLNHWFIKKALYPDTPVQDYVNTFWPAMALVNSGKFNKSAAHELANFRFDRDVAYHFDAVLFANWLKEKYCLPRGVKHIEDEVLSVNLNEDGVESLRLKSGQIVTADMFIDCTGFKSLLIEGALKEPFISMEDKLPNNRAWACQIPYTDKEKELELFTNCTAIDNGWVWNIGLWNRLGTGYVYSDKFVSPDKALEEFKAHLNSNKMKVHNPNRVTEDLKFKDVKFRSGIFKRLWVKNVVAIGLAGAFVEPLESNGLLTVHEFALALVKVIGDKPKVNQFDKDTFNTRVRFLFNNFAEFIALHYALSIRDDTEYWRHVTKKCYSPEMINQVPVLGIGYNDLVNRKMHMRRHEGEGGINCIATGMNYFVFNLADVIDDGSIYNTDMKREADEFTKRREMICNLWKEVADKSPTICEYLKENIYND